jgi:hypothetical protein
MFEGEMGLSALSSAARNYVRRDLPVACLFILIYINFVIDIKYTKINY